jgi:hypothetical protein
MLRNSCWQGPTVTETPAFDLTFLMGTIHRVLKAESLLKERSVPVRVEVAPRQLSADCGMVVTVRREDLTAVLGLFEGASLSFEGLYRRAGAGYEEIPPAALSRSGEGESPEEKPWK